MFFTYIWQSSGLSCGDAQNRFRCVLLKQCSLYQKAYGHAPAIKTSRAGNILIGQIGYDPGITGWSPWTDDGNKGLAWGGVCENFLGKEINSTQAGEIADILENHPGRMLDWDGMFWAAAWDSSVEKAVLATASTACPTLWHTKGRFGWAAGPRAVPLLELVGNKIEPDIDAMDLFLLFGYYAGGHSPFRNIKRVADRQQITIIKDDQPAFKTYASLREFLDTGREKAQWEEKVAFAANRLINRTGIHLAHSLDPVVLLTGGRDSRSIVASAKKTGRNFITATGGPSVSEDVVIASRIARSLNVKHRLDNASLPVDRYCVCMDQMRAWTQMTEGIIPLEFSLYMGDFYESRLPYPAKRMQYLHGLEPGIGRGSFYPNYPDVDINWIASAKTRDIHSHFLKANQNSYLKPNARTGELLQAICNTLDEELHETGGGPNHWFELLLWRQRGLFWGMDLQSVHSPVRWAWMPLFDRQLMSLSWNLTVRQKIDARLLLDASALMQTVLYGFPCTQYTGGRRKGLAGRIKNKVLYELMRHSRIKAKQLESAQIKEKGLPEFWEAGLINNSCGFWMNFIDKKNLQKIIQISPANALLWRLITINLSAEVLF